MCITSKASAFATEYKTMISIIKLSLPAVQNSLPSFFTQHFSSHSFILGVEIRWFKPTFWAYQNPVYILLILTTDDDVITELQGYSKVSFNPSLLSLYSIIAPPLDGKEHDHSRRLKSLLCPFAVGQTEHGRGNFSWALKFSNKQT